MEKLLNVLASKLAVQTLVETEQIKTDGCLTCFRAEYSYEDVSNEVKEAFRDNFIAHLSEKFQEIAIGDYVDYTFDYKLLTPFSVLHENMEEVFSTLPPLDSGKNYYFPPETFFRIRKVNDIGSANLVAFSTWIAKELYSQ